MYPDAELARLELHKSTLRLRIAIRRLEISIAAKEVERPIAWLDRVLAFWRKISPLAKFAAVPAVLLARRVLLKRTGIFGTLLRWGPAIFSAGKVFGKMRSQNQTG
ncbi:MAG: hypothetical protein ABI222_06660 [Opitutaceae bacterium]